MIAKYKIGNIIIHKDYGHFYIGIIMKINIINIEYKICFVYSDNYCDNTPFFQDIEYFDNNKNIKIL